MVRLGAPLLRALPNHDLGCGVVGRPAGCLCQRQTSLALYASKAPQHNPLVFAKGAQLCPSGQRDTAPTTRETHPLHSSLPPTVSIPPPTARLTLAELAALPAWTHQESLSLEGQCLGAAMREWGPNVCRRWGADAADRIRADIGVDEAALPSSPDESSWLPVGLQVCTTEAIIRLFLGGDGNALEALVWEDLERTNPSKAGLRMLQWTGPSLILRQVSRIHKRLYTVGEATGRVSRAEATIELKGAALFANPTWQLLQLTALRILLRAAGRKDTALYGQMPTADAFHIHLSWRK